MAKKNDDIMHKTGDVPMGQIPGDDEMDDLDSLEGEQGINDGQDSTGIPKKPFWQSRENGLDTYLRHDHKMPAPYTHEEENDAFRHFRLATGQEREDIRNEIIEHNIGLALKHANKYRGLCHMSRDDLFQEGVIALMRSAETFDETLGTRFSTYAWIEMDRRVARAIMFQEREIHLPVHIAEKTARVAAALASNGPDTSDTVLSELTGLDLETVRQAREWLHPPMSLDSQPSPSADEELSLGQVVMDTRVDVERQVTDSIRNEDLMGLVRETLCDGKHGISPECGERLYNVVLMRFGLGGEPPATLEQVGKKYNVTRERARQMEEQALKRLRLSPRMRQYMDS